MIEIGRSRRYKYKCYDFLRIVVSSPTFVVHLALSVSASVRPPSGFSTVLIYLRPSSVHVRPFFPKFRLDPPP